MNVRIDLHSHSDVSDGTMPPADVVRQAVLAHLDVLALTDHDTAGGWDEAMSAAREVGLALIPGMEISTKHRGRGVHLLAYLVDPDHPALADELSQILDGRDGRLEAMLEQLAAVGRPVAEDDVRRRAGSHGVIGRPHVADAMVDLGYAETRSQAFDEWLNPGQPGFVTRYAPSTEAMVRIVAEAGGASVIAHPWTRGSREVLDRATLAGFAAAGLVGIEVDHQHHSPDDRTRLRGLATDLGLVATGSSDYHGVGKVDHELGVNLTAPGELARLLEAASANAAASGRSVPRVSGLDIASLRS